MELKNTIDLILKNKNQLLSSKEISFGELLFYNGYCHLLTQSQSVLEFIILEENGKSTECTLSVTEEGMICPLNNKDEVQWDRYSFACLLQIHEEIHLLDMKDHPEHKKYTRAGMIKRVLKERRQKAEKADYRIQLANNIYGDHTVINEEGVRYKVFLRDFEQETGYSDSMDAKVNKLGTTKHIMYVFNYLKQNKELGSGDWFGNVLIADFYVIVNVLKLL